MGGLLAVIVAVTMVAGGSLFHHLFLNDTFSNRLAIALQNNRLFSPPGDCVADIYSAEKAKNPNSQKLREAASVIRAKLEPMGDSAFQRWYTDSDQTVDWDDTGRLYSFLESLFPNDKSLSAHRAYCEGQKAMDRKDFTGALKAYQEALTDKPNWVLALNGLGKVFVRKDSPYFNESRALQYYQEATRVDPNFTWALRNIGEFYRIRGDWATAYPYLQAAVKTNPNKASSLRAAGDTAYHLGRYDEAIDYLELSIQHESDQALNQKVAAAIYKIKAKRGY